MARKARKSCKVKIIRFKTKRGHKVSFKGRPGGQKKHGGICANKASTSAQRSWRKKFASAGRKCHGKWKCVERKLSR